MCVCIHIYKVYIKCCYIHIYIYVYNSTLYTLYICVYTHTYIYICMYVCIYVYIGIYTIQDFQVISAVQLYPTICDPMNCSTPGLPVHHQLPEFIQTHVH